MDLNIWVNSYTNNKIHGDMRNRIIGMGLLINLGNPVGAKTCGKFSLMHEHLKTKQNDYEKKDQNTVYALILRSFFLEAYILFVKQ